MAIGYRFDDDLPKAGSKLAVFKTLSALEQMLADTPEKGKFPGHYIFEITGQWHRGGESDDSFTIIVESARSIRRL